MRKKTGITDLERDFFRRQMKHAPIIDSPEDAKTPADKPSPVCETQYILDENGYFHKKGMQNKRLRELREGKWAICANVDLHGHTLHEAEAMMEDILEKANERGWRLVRIVHGKGTGRLREWLKGWLRLQPNIVAWQPASRQDGGDGAGFLLLKPDR